jgi:hypothetical protein
MALEPECAFDPRSSREHPGLWTHDWLSSSHRVSTFQSLSGGLKGLRRRRAPNQSENVIVRYDVSRDRLFQRRDDSVS